MDISNLVKAGTRLVGQSGLRVQKYSPEILVGVGIVGLVTAGVLAARASRDLDPMILHYDHQRDDIDEAVMTEAEKKAAYKAALQNQVKDVVKMYGPAVTLGAVSVVSILAGHHVLKSRNIALAAAYKVLETSYAEYRKRVAAEIGDDREGLLYRGQKEVTTSKGKVTKQVSPHGSPYARCFDKVNSTEWTPHADLNLTLILSVQRFANIQLQVKGFVFLNDVYAQLGFEPTPAGQLVGWFYDRHNADGDGYIDFGLDDPDNEMGRMFIQGNESSVWLDFNVDGQIYDKI